MTTVDRALPNERVAIAGNDSSAVKLGGMYCAEESELNEGHGGEVQQRWSNSGESWSITFNNAKGCMVLSKHWGFVG